MRHKSLLNKLADQYETVDFLQGDPAWFMHQVVGKRNQETMEERLFSHAFSTS